MTHAQAPDPLVNVGRVGWAVRGVLYLAFAAAVWAVVTAGSNTSASQRGGLDLLADAVPDWMLYGLSAGLVLYALWRFTEGVQPYGDWTGKALLERGGAVVSSVVYSGLAWIAFEMASSDRESQGSGSSSGLAPEVLTSIGGQLIFGAVGLVLLGAGVWFGREGLNQEFRDHVDEGRTPGHGTLLKPLGIAGHLARGVVYGIFGLFVLRVTIAYDPEKAKGIDRALTEVGQTSWGRPLLMITALGLAAYGLYCLVSAPGQQLETPRAD